MQIDASSSSFASPPSRQPRRLPAAESAAPASASASTRDESGGDAIELSSEARRVVEFPKDARARADLVARLRQEVDAGTYRPDADAVARRLAERADH